ncbi:MAG: 2-amino-4-hydroxy-6-hydroxymethyldihydropteridine diphosphokinase [Anaerolineae bacterium]|nr:MAG: 2-amino-4-hydroxy-6-hydroxymethyldihydropteridine diphosphokinase [Anaerolineae bacterium]
MSRHIAYLGLGSNLGDRAANLATAIERLVPSVVLTRASSLYETDPWGYSDQPAFLNQAIEAHTDLAPRALLDFLKGIEVRVGRIPTFPNGPREIDLDILFYDDLVLNEPGLTIPHPRLEQRAFAIVPLAEIALELIHPVSGLTISEIAAQLNTSSIRRIPQNTGTTP